MGYRGHSSVFMPIFYGGKHMWNVIGYFAFFGFGTVVGVVLMCLLQAAKMADEKMEVLMEAKEKKSK